jgi:hypothetical protein
MNKIKTLLPGILVGILIAVLGMFAWNYAEDVATKKMAEKFLSGLEQAEDKVAFVVEFANNNGGVMVFPSTSQADEGEGDGDTRGYCQIQFWIDQIGEAYMNIGEFKENLGAATPEQRKNLEGMIKGFEDKIRGLVDKIRGCSMHNA